MTKYFLLLSMLVVVAMATGCRRPQVRLELEPAVVSACNLPVAVGVRWDASALGLKRARVEVNNLGRQPKVWIDGASRGHALTGTWANDGFTVTLRSMNGVELGRRTLMTTPCPGKGWL